MSMNTYPLIVKKAFIVDEEVAAYIQRTFDTRMKYLPEEIANMSDAEFAEAAKKGNITLCNGEPYVDNMCNILDILQQYSCSENDFFFVNEFDGEVEYCHVRKDGAYMEDGADFDPLTRNFEEDYIVCAEPEKNADYFSRSYESEDELIAEYKEHLSEFNFPENFNWKAHIVDICGTYFS